MPTQRGTSSASSLAAAPEKACSGRERAGGGEPALLLGGQVSGGASKPLRWRSMWRATPIAVRSSRYGATTWMPTGSPVRVRPTGAKAAGRYAAPARPVHVDWSEILDGLRRGNSNAEVAARLYLSPKTVEHHVSRVLAKLGARTRAEAAAVAASAEALGGG